MPGSTSSSRGGKCNSSQHLVTKPFPPPGLPPLPQPRAGSVRFHWARLAFPFACAARGRPEFFKAREHCFVREARKT